MIVYCRDFLKTLLTNLQITPVYIRREDVDNYKGLTFSAVAPGREQLSKINRLVAKEDKTITSEDQTEVPVRIYRREIYESRLPVYVTLVGKNLAQAEIFRQNFLKALGNSFLDPDNNAIFIEAQECDTLEEVDSIQNPREGYQITVMFTGGIYVDEIIHRITGDIVPVLENKKEG